MSNHRNSKIKIQALKVNANPDFITKQWEKLKSAIKQIQAQRDCRLSYEELYRYGYHMVLHKKGAELYNGVRTLVMEHLQGREMMLKAAIPQMNFLTCINRTFDEHHEIMVKIRDVLLYLDRQHSESRLQIYELGLQIFHEQLISQVQFHD